MDSTHTQSSLISALEWRYATKQFDPERKVSSEDIEQIKRATQLSASSYGFQPYTILVIEDAALRARLQPASMNQRQIVDSSHLFVFCSYLDFGPEKVTEILQRKSEVQGMPMDKLQGFADHVNGNFSSWSPEKIDNWTHRQSYIALGTLLAACAELRVDACPMEGFNPDQYAEILGLKERGLKAAVLAAVGYRKEEDPVSKAPKMRRPLDQLFEHH